jgi:hypothetical protein
MCRLTAAQATAAARQSRAERCEQELRQKASQLEEDKVHAAALAVEPIDLASAVAINNQGAHIAPPSWQAILDGGYRALRLRLAAAETSKVRGGGYHIQRRRLCPLASSATSINN